MMRRVQIRPITLRSVAALAAALTVMAAASVTGASAGESGKGSLTQAVKKTVLVFPFDKTNVGVSNAEEISQMLTDQAYSRLILTNAYSVTRYFKSLPTVARLHSDQQLTDADISPPYAEDNRKSAKIVKLIGYDQAFIGSIDGYEYSDGRATVTVSGRLLEVTEEGAGFRVLRNAALSATSGSGSTEEERALNAAREAGEKLMSQLAPNVTAPVTPETTKPAETKRKKRANMDWLWGVLAIGLGLGIGLSTGGGRGGGGGSDSPPPPP
jgi:hypothetical protein